MVHDMQQAPVKKKKKSKVPKAINGGETMVEIEVDDDSGPGWGPNNKHRLLNHSLSRVDGPSKVSGAAIYSYDVRLPGMLYGRILRCPHAHARLTKFDASAASNIPGVRSVIQAPLKEFNFEAAPVAAVAATTPEIADDAIRAIVAQYEVLPHVVKAQEAINADAPKAIDGSANLKEAGKRGSPQEVTAAFADSGTGISAVEK